MTSKGIRLGLDEDFSGAARTGRAKVRTGRRCLEGSGCEKVSLSIFLYQHGRELSGGGQARPPTEEVVRRIIETRDWVVHAGLHQQVGRL